MKKVVIAVLALMTCAHVIGEHANKNYVYLGVDAMRDATSVDRSVFIGSAAGYNSGRSPDGMDWGYNITSNVFIGAASGLQTYNVDSCLGIGYRTFRMATNCAHCVGIGANVFADANGKTNEVNINNQLFISPTNFWIKSAPDRIPLLCLDTESYQWPEVCIPYPIQGYFRVKDCTFINNEEMSTYRPIILHYANIVLEGGDIVILDTNAHGNTVSMSLKETLSTLKSRLSTIENQLGINQNTQTNTPTSH